MNYDLDVMLDAFEKRKHIYYKSTQRNSSQKIVSCDFIFAMKSNDMYRSNLRQS